jgi:Animal haem peroxidase
MSPFKPWFHRNRYPFMSQLFGQRPATMRRRCLQIEPLEERALLSAGIESINGTGNNLANPDLGSAGTDLIRVAPAAYADGVSAPAGANRPGARAISNALSDQTDPSNPSQDLNTINQKSLSDFIYVFGQFLDHDLDLTLANSGQAFDIAPGSPLARLAPPSSTQGSALPAQPGLVPF